MQKNCTTTLKNVAFYVCVNTASMVSKTRAASNLNSTTKSLEQKGVDFINCFMPYAELSRLAPNFCASKKLLKSWAQGAKVWRRGAKPFMKSTLGGKITLWTVWSSHFLPKCSKQEHIHCQLKWDETSIRCRSSCLPDMLGAILYDTRKETAQDRTGICQS